jgi:hypothetical protein
VNQASQRIVGTPPPDPEAAVRQNPDWVEQRIKGVGIFGWGGPFRLDQQISSPKDRSATSVPRSFFMDRSKFTLTSDPFAGRAKMALVAEIYASEAEATAAVRAMAALLALKTSEWGIYAFYRGPENIIFPTIISDKTTPALVRALRKAIAQEREDAKAAQYLLINAFFTLGGLRYAPIAAPEAVTMGAAGEAGPLRESARKLLQQQPRGKVVLNLGGTGEVSGAINVNPLTGQQVGGIPNLIQTTAESVGEVFPTASVDSVISNNIVYGQVNWAVAAKGCFATLRSGGTISIAPYAGQLAEHLQAIAQALKAAGFRQVIIQSGRIVTAVK